jgi:hypothetical protein
MEKFGAKEIFHRIFSAMQFQHSMFKCDLGLIIYLLTTTYIFDNENTILLVTDAVYFLVSVGVMYLMRKKVKDYNKVRSEMKKGQQLIYFSYSDRF